MDGGTIPGALASRVVYPTAVEVEMSGHPAAKGPRSRPVIHTPDQRLRVFVSSSLEELAAERAAARRAIEHLRLTPVLFELGARPHPPRDLYRAYLDQSQVFVGIYGERYGWIGPGESVSGLEDEYLLSGHRPKLIYIKRTPGTREPRLGALLARIRTDDLVSYREFSTAAELGDLIENDLAVLLTERFEKPAESDSDTLRMRRHLPAPTTSLIGRGEELAEVGALFRTAEARLVTLTGMGGIGKTRLAIQVAYELADVFEDGVFFVDCAHLRQPALVPSAVAAAVGVEEQPDRPPEVVLREHLEGRRTLLILDNFEVVDDAAPLLADLLRAAPRLAVLVTSRAPLRLSGEHEYRVRPMPLADAVRLFAARARTVAPAFRRPREQDGDVVELCRRLDCLPLAVELTAARTRDFAASELLGQVPGTLELATGGGRDVPSRQRTLRATLDWSYRLLPRGERQLFSRLAVFAGGFTISSAEVVCGGRRSTLASLVGSSLLRESLGGDGELRYYMLETVREYAADVLGRSKHEQTVRRRHAEYYATVAEAADHEPLALQPESAWRRLRAEQDNLRAALAWSDANGEVDLELRLVGALSYFWMVHGHFREGYQRIDAALSHPVAGSPALRAAALAAGARLAHSLGDYRQMRTYSEEGLELSRSLEDRRAMAFALNGLGIALGNLGEIDRSVDLHEESAAISRELNDDRTLAAALNNLGYRLLRRGEHARARELCEEGLRVCQRLGYATGTSVVLGNLGLVALLEQRYDDARVAFREGLLHDLELGYTEGMIYGLAGAAVALTRSARDVEAATLLGAAHAATEATGVKLELLESELRAQATEQLRGSLGADGFAEAHAAGGRLGVEEATSYAIQALDSEEKPAGGRE